jgi:MFS family permease
MSVSVRRGALSAYHIYLVLEGFYSLFFSMIATVNLVYQVEVAHLNPLQLVLVGTTLESVTFILQVPTGALADIYGRRPAVVLGTFLIGVGFVLGGLIPRFGVILLAQVIWGAGATLMDGATEAWIPRIARRGIESSERLGRYRWVVERTLSWLNHFRRLKVRYERRADMHHAFLLLGCALICFRML